MSVLLNHARRHDFADHNPITLVRQSAKRRTVPEVLLPSEINRLVSSLPNRERTLVVMAAGMGLRMSELFGLKWGDVDFAGKQASVLRSIVKQAVGPFKTEASQKPVPLDPRLVRTLRAWRRTARFRKPTDWVFASPVRQGKSPFWGQVLMRHYIRPATWKLLVLNWRPRRDLNPCKRPKGSPAPVTIGATLLGAVLAFAVDIVKVPVFQRLGIV
jgi:integrase